MREGLKVFRGVVIWAALVGAIIAALAGAAASPQLAWRHPIYIGAGFAGIAAMALLLVQPLLMSGRLPGIAPRYARRAHRWVGTALVAAVVVHVLGLWLTSAPDVIDALLFESPTPFSPWGVTAMWAVFILAALAGLRRRLPLQPQTWRALHLTLGVTVAMGSMVHALLIEGTMETVSKIALCTLITAALVALFLGRGLLSRRAASR